ncbi:cysteine-tryptophan domain-containing zinc finger protein 7-like [Hibiscus syriacus]|uniref:cysteine-tryptophan domain-containing zinc finger protein 7-like n=1 Tax=Hibiscus syriacus TaxID=106335 RepID=UPI0019242EC3|nr:cysteine-tryptophan domain-containing zinc finger protein 7-like [Hibiscus syriacus]
MGFYFLKDEKIKNVLGHFQKDFEGGVSAENLGAKFGGYGSFLPTYEHSPPRLSCPKIPQKNTGINQQFFYGIYLSAVDCITIQDASQNLKAPPNALPTGRARNISCPSANIAANHDSHLTSAQVVEKSALKDESFNRARIPSDQKTLKVRIKMRSEKKAQKLAAIYSGLGLDFSPSLSLGDSPDECGGTLMVSQETTSKSPTRILQVEVSFGSFQSAMLIKKGKSSMLIDDSVLGNRKQLHEKKPKFLIRKSEELVESKHRNHMYVESGKTLLIKKKQETKIAGGESLPNDLKHTSPSSPLNIAMEATARVCDVSAEANQNALRGGLFSSDSGKEDSLESISGRSRPSGKKKKRDKRSSLDEKGWEQSVDNSNKNASLDLGDNFGSKCYQKSAPLKLEEDSKTKVGQIAIFHVQNKISIPSKKEKTLEGKKSKDSKNTGEVADSMKESLRPDVGLTLKDTTSSNQGFSSDKDKIWKLKLQEDINKVQGNGRDALETNSEQKWGQMGSTMRHFQNRLKGYDPMDFEMEHDGYLDKLKVKVSGRTVDNHLSGVAAPDVVPHLYDRRLPSQMAAPAAPAPVVIEENWVLCDRCHKWRLLPFDTRPEQLPEKWLCSMLNWLPRMNQCDISEDETTKALNALYQASVAGNQITHKIMQMEVCHLLLQLSLSILIRTTLVSILRLYLFK